MTIYNIDDPKQFLNILSTCSGKIDLIADNGLFVEIKPAGLPVTALVRMLLSSQIDKINLSFRQKEDAQKVLNYIMGMKRKQAS